MRTITYILFTVSLLASTDSHAFGRKKPLVVLIPGAGSSGDRVYVNGLSSLPLVGDHYFKAIQDEVNHNGAEAIVCPKERDQDSRTIEERAEDCVKQIQDKRAHCTATDPRDVLLVGHSMGGLVARTLAQDPRVQGCIHSVTSVSTPHKGTPLADWAILHGELDDNSFDFLGRFVNIIHFRPRDLHYLPELKSTRANADPSLFKAQDMPDNPAVAYYSITTSQAPNPIPFLEASRLIIGDEMRARHLDGGEYGTKNDGIVPEYSMVHGTVVGHLEINHFASACIDPIRLTPECRSASKMLIDHLTAIAPRH